MPSGPRRIGFVGLGNMGLPMSRRLVEAGFVVTGFDLSKAARRRAADAGILATDCLAQVARGATWLALMLPGSDAVEAVLADQSLLSELTPGTEVLEMSSSEPLRTRLLAAQLAARRVTLVDAPVSGGVTGAEGGTLTIMAGGEAADVEAARPCLAPLGRVVHVGPVGAGHALKALNNLLSATHLLATGEAMLAGTRFGIDPEVMLSVLNSSSGRCGSTEVKWPRFVLPGSFDSGFALRLMVKDMGIAARLAEQVGAPRALGRSALELWTKAADLLPPTADHTEIARWLESEAG